MSGRNGAGSVEIGCRFAGRGVGTAAFGFVFAAGAEGFGGGGISGSGTDSGSMKLATIRCRITGASAAVFAKSTPEL